MAIRLEDYIRSATDLITQANRNSGPVKAKCARCFDTIAVVSKADDAEALANKLYAHKSSCPRTAILIH